jgi:hypothetical protein
MTANEVLTRLITPESVIPAIPHREIDVNFPMHFADEILNSPSSVIWQPQQLRELEREYI